MNVNGTLDKEVDVQNIRYNFVEVHFVDMYPFHRYKMLAKSDDFCRFVWTPLLLSAPESVLPTEYHIILQKFEFLKRFSIKFQ